MTADCGGVVNALVLPYHGSTPLAEETVGVDQVSTVKVMGENRYPISPAQRETYTADGALFLPGVLDSTWIERLRESVENLEAKERRDGSPQGFFDRMRLWEHDRGFRDIVFDSPAAGIAAGFIEVDRLNLLYDQLFVKRPGSNVRTPWHTDLPNWPVTGSQLITIWVALDRIDTGNGRLEFIRGSHRWGRDTWITGTYGDEDGRISRFHITDPETEPQEVFRARYAALETSVAAGEHEVLAWDTEPGDAIVFDACTLHGALGNRRPDQKRRAYSMRFAGPDVRYHPIDVANVAIMSDSLGAGDPLDGDQYPVVYQV